MLPAQRLPSTSDAGCSATGGSQDADLSLGLPFKATENLINLQLDGPRCGERGAEDLLCLADS